jgi:hypothetical protein
MPQVNFTLVKRENTPVEMLPKEQIKDEFFDLNTQQFMTISRSKPTDKRTREETGEDFLKDVRWRSREWF